MADHKPGSMDVTTQEKTFNGFVSMVTRAVVLIFAFLIFLALVNG
jgi:hypothetical protein